jgi:hypothetical protein
MAQDIIAGDLRVHGNISCNTFSPPAGSINNQAILGDAQIAAEKLQQQGNGIWTAVELFGPLTAVTALTKTLGMAYAPGTLVDLDAWIEVVATGADRTVTVDLHKSTGGGAYSTVLSGTIGFRNVSTVRVAVGATISTPAYVAGDIFRLVVTVAGSAGAQATGLTVRLTAREDSQ